MPCVWEVGNFSLDCLAPLVDGCGDLVESEAVFSLFIVSAGHGSGLDETFLPRKCKNATKNVSRRTLDKQSLASSIISSVSCFVHTVGIIYAIYTLSSRLPNFP